MREIRRYILMCAMSLLALAGCDVHEFPEKESLELVPYTLHLDFNTDMPLYDEFHYDAMGLLTRDGEGDTKGPANLHDVRYTIKAYRTDNVIGENRIADTTYVFTHSEIEKLNYTAKFGIREGVYTFQVWCDYVNTGSEEDKYWNTENFERIAIRKFKNEDLEVQIPIQNGDVEEEMWVKPDSLLVGSSDFRDAFRGFIKEQEVRNPKFYAGDIVSTIKNESTVEMIRPLGKYKFISTDVDKFISRLAKKMQKNGKLSSSLDDISAYNEVLQNINLNQFRVVFRYGFYMPFYFNMFTDKPGDSWMGTDYMASKGYTSGHLIYESRMTKEVDPETGKTEMLLGFDYLIVNGTTGLVNNVTVEVYDMEDGELMSRSKLIDIEFKRSQLTIIKGEFLTSKASGGVSINPGYDGPDYNIPVRPLHYTMDIIEVK